MKIEFCAPYFGKTLKFLPKTVKVQHRALYSGKTVKSPPQYYKNLTKYPSINKNTTKKTLLNQDEDIEGIHDSNTMQITNKS